MNEKLKIVLYGLVVFAVYIVILVIIRLLGDKIPENATIFGFFAPNDIYLGLIVAVVLTFSHIRRKRL